MKLSDMHLRDPYILPYDNKYYLYFSPGKYAWSGYEGFYCTVSEDLVNWSEPVKCFTPPEGFWATDNYWAPEVHYYNGRFYLFASFYAKGHMRAVQIMASDSPVGPFEVWSCPITPNHWMCLDGTFYIEDGKPYMVFCHEWLQTYDGEVCAVELSEDLKQPIGEPKLLFKASESKWASNKDVNGYITDGPFLYKTADGKLIMTWSSLDESRYSVGVAYSENGSLFGEWKHCENTLSDIDGGHGMIFKSYDGHLYFTMHYREEPNSLEHPCLIEFEEILDEPFIAIKKIIK